METFPLELCLRLALSTPSFPNICCSGGASRVKFAVCKKEDLSNTSQDEKALIEKSTSNDRHRRYPVCTSGERGSFRLGRFGFDAGGLAVCKEGRHWVRRRQRGRKAVGAFVLHAAAKRPEPRGAGMLHVDKG